MKKIETRCSFNKGVRTSEYYLEGKKIGYGIVIYSDKGNHVDIFNAKNEKLGEAKGLVEARKKMFEMLDINLKDPKPEKEKKVAKAKTIVPKKKSKEQKDNTKATTEQVVAAVETGKIETAEEVAKSE